jgi:spermidine/putrescine transport system ATP-binding protein
VEASDHATLTAPDGKSGAVGMSSLRKGFGDVRAVDGIDLEVASGEFMTLLGPSGCGKTTTLRLVAGFERPDSGRIELDGKDVAAVPSYKRPVNTVFQQFALFPQLSVERNIGYGLKHSGVSKDEISIRVREMMELMEIPSVGDRRPRQLSGGQQQRVALARALVMRPRVLLLDEPLGSLDYKLRKSMQFELKKIHHEIGTTFIYVTHDQEEAMTMSDRIVVMNGGRIEQVGTPAEIYDEPESPFVADFVGDTNLLTGTVTRAGEDKADVKVEPLGTISGTAVGSVTSGGQAILSIRPSDIRLDASEEGSVVVRDAVLAGGYVEVKMDIGQQDLVAHVPRLESVAPGTRVAIRVDSDRARVFGG